LPSVSKVAVKVLVNVKESALSALESAYNVPEQSTTQLRLQIIQIYGRIKSRAAVALLLDKLAETDRNLRYEILGSLQLCHYQATTKKEKLIIKQHLQQEVNYSIKILSALSFQEIKDKVSLLSVALDDELDKTRTNIFLLLSFIYPPETIMKIGNNFNEDAAQLDMALELLEHTVNKAHKQLIFPILQKTVSQNSLVFSEFLKEIISQREHNAWLRVCAIEAAVMGIAIEDFKLLILPLLNDREKWVRETAKYMLSLTGGSPATFETLPTIEKVKSLQSVSIFCEIPDEMLAEISTIIEEITVDEGEYIYHQGDYGSSLYIIAEGLLHHIYNGEKILNNLQQGDIFGVLSALVPEQRVDSIIALQKSKLFKISQEELQKLMETRIKVAIKIIKFLYYRLLAFPRKRQNLQQIGTISIEKTPRKIKIDKPLSLIEKMIILKTVSIFSNTPDNILSKIASFTQDVFLEKNRVLFKQGDLNPALYIIVEGSVKVYDEEQLIVKLGDRETIGELSTLFSEPETVSVATLEDTHLLSLTHSDRFELMREQHEIVQGIIRVLVQRLRSIIK